MSAGLEGMLGSGHIHLETPQLGGQLSVCLQTRLGRAAEVPQ